MIPDYLAGLNTVCSRIDPSIGIGVLDMFGAANLIVMHPPSVTKVLCSSVEHALHGLKPASEAFFGKKVLFVLAGEEWLSLRRLMKTSFQRHNMDRLSGDVSAVAQTLQQKLAPYAASGAPLDMLQAISMFHLSAVGKVAFSHDLECMERFDDGPNAICQSFEFMLSELPRRAFSPDPQTQNDYASDTEDNIKWRRAASTVRGVISGVVRARLAEKDKKAKAQAQVQAQEQEGEAAADDLLECMIRAYEAEQAGGAGTVGAAGAAEAGQAPAPRAHTADELTAALGDNLIEILFAG
jgi:cytochrome P450